MKPRLILTALVVLALALIGTMGLGSRGQAQEGRPSTETGVAPQALMGTAFTYQGQLTKDGGLVDGTCDFEFRLWDAASGGTQIGATQTKTNISVSNGLFTIPSLDFGSGAFQGEARWLQISVRCPTGSGSYTVLSPRQALTPAPYALALPGLWTQQNATSPNLIGGYSDNVVLAGVVGATIGGGGGATLGVNRVTDNYGTVGGGWSNQAGDNTGTVDDRSWATVGGGYSNMASGAYATVGGGNSNTASGAYATVGGGDWNTASGAHATVGGGEWNTASKLVATVGGGHDNTASGEGATVGGGGENQASGWYATVGGGNGNTASAAYATVGGGQSSTAQGNYSFAAGRRAKANDEGAFVWGDATDADIASTAANQFVVRATGGARLYGGGRWDLATTEGDLRIGNDTHRLKIGVALAGGGAGDVWFRADGGSNRMHFWSPGGLWIYTNAAKTSGMYLAAGSSSWNVVSNRDLKENFRPVDSRQLLARLAAIPITTWNYKAQDPAIRHIGPMADDFNSLIEGLGGEGPDSINSLDADGVALAAIQGLYQLSQEKDARIAQLEEENFALRSRLDGLEARLAALESGAGRCSQPGTRRPLPWLAAGGLVLGGGVWAGWRRRPGGGR